MRAKALILIGTVLLIGVIAYFVLRPPPQAPPPTDVFAVLPEDFVKRMPVSVLATFAKQSPAAAKVLAASTGSTASASAAVGVTLDFSGNGKDLLTITADNPTAVAQPVALPAGTLFTTPSGKVVLVRTIEFSVPANRRVEQRARTIATSAAALPEEGPCKRRDETVPSLARLLDAVANKPAVSLEAIQTAALAVTENAPLDTFARFPRLAKDTSANRSFKVPTATIVEALLLLRDAGYDAGNLALATDPQLKIEAMVDPDAHGLALAYFGIPPNAEWSFWKNHLLRGDFSTRHYGLFGIARNFPEVALDMLPTWARETRLRPILRSSSIQALAFIPRPAALRELERLAADLAAEPELEKAARRAILYAKQESGKTSAATTP